jgi:hypothetical protein
MISLNFAKLLLFISLCLGPHYGAMDRTVEISNKNAYCVWTHDSDGWALTQLGTVVNHWPANGSNITENDLKQIGPTNHNIAHQIAAHDWKHDSALYFDNGDVLEKQGNKIFYTLNAGAPNQQIFSIIIMEKGKVL